jgi:hypothetical protein
LAALVVTGTSACTFLSPAATLTQYDPSDGVNGTVADLKIRNAIVLNARDGSVGSLLVSLVNGSDTDLHVTIQYADADGNRVDEMAMLAAGQSTKFGSADHDRILLENIDVQPGSLLPVFFTYGGETGVELLVPVLDGTLSQYSDLVPSGAPQEG